MQFGSCTAFDRRGAAPEGYFQTPRKLKDEIYILLHILIFHKIKSLEKLERAQSAMTYSYPRNGICVGGQRHAPAALPPGKEPRTRFTGG